MRIVFFLIVPLFVTHSCGTQEEHVDDMNLFEEIIDSSINQNVDTTLNLDNNLPTPPARMSNDFDLVLSEADGDLDKDGVPEKVVVYARDLEWESSAPRDLVIYKQKDGEWIEWVNTENTILRADEGGMMGDPFVDASVDNGILEISHSGGSSWKWGHTEKYRYQDGGFYMIGFTSTYGKPCEYWEDLDYNLSTGNCIFIFSPDICDDYETQDYGSEQKEKFTHKMNKLPPLKNRRDFNYEFESPNGEKIYL